MRIALLFSLTFWGLIAVFATGCGMYAGVHPITSAEQHSEYEPTDFKCLWGDCARLQQRGLK